MAGKTLVAGVPVKTFASSFNDNTRQYRAGQISYEAADWPNVEAAHWADTGYLVPSGYPVKLTVGGTLAASQTGESVLPSAVAPTFTNSFATDATVSGFALLAAGASQLTGSDVAVNDATFPDFKFARRGRGITILVPWTGSTTVNTLGDVVAVGWDDSQNGGAGALTDTGANLIALTGVKVKNIYPGKVVTISSSVASWTDGYVAEIQI